MRKAWIDARHPMVNQILWGLTLLERNLKELKLLAIEEVVVITLEEMEPGNHFCHSFPGKLKIYFEYIESWNPFETLGAELRECNELILVLEGNALNDRRILKSLLSSHAPCAVISPTGSKPAGAAILSVSESALFENKYVGNLTSLLFDAVKNSKINELNLSNFEKHIVNLRREIDPFLLLVEDSEQLEEADQVLRQTVHKGVNDFVAKYIHPRLEFGAVQFLALKAITPNQITIFWVLLAGFTIPLIVTGHLLLGIFLAAICGILDGIDGKLARLTLRFSKAGDLLDHVTGTIYDGLFYLALGWHFSEGDLNSTSAKFTSILFVSYCVERVVPGIFKKLHRVEIYDYAKIDRFIRLIGSRINNNIWLLLIATILGWPKEGFYFISLWMLVTASWHTLRLLSRYNSFVNLYLKLKK